MTDIAARPAVILVNLGSPDVPEPGAVRRYLRQFLSDRRVVETHPLLWRPILEGIILRVRPRRSAEKYQLIWEDRGSPLRIFTQEQAEYVHAALASSNKHADADVFFAMRYGATGVQEVMQRLFEDGYRKLLVIPLYPQFSATTVASITDEVYRWNLRARDQFDLRVTRAFPTDGGYIDALVAAIETCWEQEGRPHFAAGDKLVLSYHGIPQAMSDAGDPYAQECLATTKAVRERLGLDEHQALMTFQSVFGPAQWLKPATIDTVAQLGAGGTRRVDVICPGFVSDCLETLEEIDVENRAAFTNAGGAEFNYIPWGNAHEPWLRALANLTAANLVGW